MSPDPLNPYSPPQQGDPASEDVEAQQGASTLVAAGGAMAAAAGILMLATSWQLLSMLWFQYAWLEAWVYAIGGCGAVALVSGAGFTQARKWAIYPAVASTSLGALCTGSWVIYVLIMGGFTMVSFVGAGVAAGAALLTGMGMGMAQRVVAAREELYADPE